jgi:hypothetical protein
MNPTAWAIVGVGITALLALIGTVYTARSARRATDRSADIADRAEFTASYSKLAQDLRGDRDAVRAETADVRAEMTDVKKRTDRLEQRYWVAVRYIRQLRAIVVAVATDQVPPIPAELEQDV